MRVYIDWDPDDGAKLECVGCFEPVLNSHDGDVEVDELIQVMKAHEYACKSRVTVLANKYCNTCGEKLYTTSEVKTPRCLRCNLTIPAAMQAHHELQWAIYTDSNFRPACTCGWRSQIGHTLETNAWKEWDEHPKRGLRPNLRVVHNGND